MNTLLFSAALLASVISMGSSQIDNTIDATNWVGFDCRRPTGSVCSGQGICGPTTGICTCNVGFVGTHDCSLSLPALVTGNEPQLLAGTFCTPQCDNGQCYRTDRTDATTGSCFCEPEYTGATCSLARGSVACRVGDMVVQAYPQPFTSFSGMLAVEMPGSNTLLIDTPACFVRATPTQTFEWNLQRFSQSFSTATTNVDNPCLAGLQTTTSPAGLEVCYSMRLVYSPFLISTPSDEVFRFCCVESGDGNAGVVSVGTDKTVDDNTGLADVEGSVTIIVSRLVHTLTNVIVQAGDDINVGSRISYVVSFSDIAVRYDDLRVISCTANYDTLTADPQSIPLIEGGCANPQALAILRDVRKVGKEVFVDISAFRPSTDSPVTLTCDVQVCVTACVVPSPNTCPGTSILNEGRKRRAADNSTTEDTEIIETSETFKIYVQPSSQTSCPKQPECGWMSEVFVPVAAVFGVLLVVILIVSGMLCYRQHNRRDAKESA